MSGGRFSAGQLIGSYELLAAIGSGKTGEAWKARHAILDRTVCIKFYRNLDESGKALSAFRQETGSLSELKEKGVKKLSADPRSFFIAEIYDADFDNESRLPYIVEEFVDGENLWNFVQENGPLSERETKNTGWQVAQALAYAHEKTSDTKNFVVHRDLWAGNVIKRKDGVVKVVDFGCSLSENHPSLEAVLAGALSVQSPERIQGTASTPASDVWSLGVLMYYLVKGQLPFHVPDPKTGEDRELVFSERKRKILEDVPPKLGLRDKVLESAIMQCLQKDPAKRHSADSIEKMLRKSFFDKTIERITRHPYVAAVFGVGAFVLGLIGELDSLTKIGYVSQRNGKYAIVANRLMVWPESVVVDGFEDISDAAYSPKNNSVLFVGKRNNQTDIYEVSLDSSQPSQLTNDKRVELCARAHPQDPVLIAYSFKGPENKVFLVLPLAPPDELLISQSATPCGFVWTPDCYLVFESCKDGKKTLSIYTPALTSHELLEGTSPVYGNDAVYFSSNSKLWGVHSDNIKQKLIDKALTLSPQRICALPVEAAQEITFSPGFEVLGWIAGDEVYTLREGTLGTRKRTKDKNPKQRLILTNENGGCVYESQGKIYHHSGFLNWRREIDEGKLPFLID